MKPKSRRRTLRGWFPYLFLGLAIVLFFVGSLLFQTSWWLNPNREASSDQQSPDGMSLFTDAGQNFFNVDRTILVRLTPTGASATTLGLPRDATTPIFPRVPIETRVLGTSGVFILPLVEGLKLTTKNDELVTIELDYQSNGSYQGLIDLLRGMMPSMGWTSEDFEELSADLAAAGQEIDGEYSAELRPSAKLGMTVTVTIVLKNGSEPDLIVVLERQSAPIMRASRWAIH